MDGLGRRRVVGMLVAAVVGGVLTLAIVSSTPAQTVANSAEVKQMTGRVEVLRNGQKDWAPASAGAKLVAGDQIRAYPGASAELALPDGSTLFLAENSRLAVTKIEFDDATKTRTGAFYLAVGKVRALVSKAAIDLLRTRQSNFVISTPTAVAAARGTHYEVTYDSAQKSMRVVVLPDPRVPESAQHGDPGGVYASSQAVPEGF